MFQLKPRHEIKFRVDDLSAAGVLKWLQHRGALLLHPDRHVTSTYFDNDVQQMYHETQEGLTPRSKIRLRCYGKHDLSCGAKHLLETKVTTERGRKKESHQEANWRKLLTSGLLSTTYGNCSPKVIVSYTRSYFSYQGARLTLDRRINYQVYSANPGPSFVVPDRSMALEVKAAPDFDMALFLERFPIPQQKFSKYERGIEALRLT